MGSKSKRDFKESIAVQGKYDAFYTGRGVQITQDGCFMLCCHGDNIKVVDVASGKTEAAIGGQKDAGITFGKRKKKNKKNDEDIELTCFALAHDDKTLVMAAGNGILEQWDFRERQKIKCWKTVGIGRVNCMAFDSTSSLLALGGSDSTIKVWDIIQKYYTHNFKGANGVFSVVSFYQNNSELTVFGAAYDYKIRGWGLDSRKCIATLEGHCSTVTSLQFHKDKNMLLSGGRDKVVLLWSLLDFTLMKTIPIYEGVELILLLPEGRTLPGLDIESDSLVFITAGSSGGLKAWDSTTGRCIRSQEALMNSSPEEDESQSITTHAFYNKALDAIGIVTHEHIIILYKLEDFSLIKQFVGNNDQILDIKFIGEKEEHLAVATNSPLIRIYEISTFACRLLKGHQDIVVSLDVFPRDRNMLISGSKDNNVLVWKMDSGTGEVQCLYMGHSHTHNVTAVACCKTKADFFVSASYDKTLKVWDIPAKRRFIALKTRLAVRCTVNAHDKMVNSISISVNDKLVATGSQDRTAKIWNASDLSHVGTLTGHKKSVMCVEFSPIDRVLVTASKDGTIKLWSLTDCSLLKTFDEHMCAIQKVLFLSEGTQLLSSSCDGVIKMWSIKKNVCIQTETEHSDDIFALVPSLGEDFIVSGGADSRIIVWKDITEEKRIERIEKHKDELLTEQQLLNLIREKKWVEALGLAVQLDQPLRTYKIVKEILRDHGGRSILNDTIAKMRDDQLENLLKYATEWNAVTKHKMAAFVILRAIILIKSPKELLNMQNLKGNLAALLSYADRNYQAIIRAEIATAFTDFAWRNAKVVAEVDNDILESHVTQNSKKRKAEGGDDDLDKMSKNTRFIMN